MKKFIVLLILAAAIGAGYYFYDPYLKPHLEPLFDKFSKAGPEPVDTDDGAPSGDGGKATPAPSPGPKPTATAGGSTTQPKPPAPAPAPKPPAPALSEIDQLLERKYPLPQVLPFLQIVDNWNNVPANAFPTEVALTERVSFTLKGANGQTIGASLAVPGTLVQPGRFDNPTLTIVSLANRAMRTQVNVDDTDFKDRIQKRYNDFVVSATERVKRQREAARKVLMAEPEAVAMATSTAAWDSAEDPRFAPVKASLVAGDLPSVRPEEATGFRWVGKQTIRGKLKGSYDSVLVSFDVVTIFGMFPTEWLAILENGRVVGWVDPITHETSALVP